MCINKWCLNWGRDTKSDRGTGAKRRCKLPETRLTALWGLLTRTKASHWMDGLIDWLNAKTHSGSHWGLPATVLFWPETWRNRLRQASLRGSDPPQPESEPEAVGLEQNECNWSHLGRKNYFCWRVSSSTWRRLVCYGKTLKTIDCLWAVAHLSYDPSSMPQQFS